MLSVLISASGTGSRLKELTSDKSKAIIDVGGKPALLRILESYPANTRIIVTVEYKKEGIIEFLNSQQVQTNVEIVVGSPVSLGASMLNAESSLQCPFIFHCCDTFISPMKSIPQHNFSVGFKTSDLAFSSFEQYSTLIEEDGKIVEIRDKSTNPGKYIHVGVVGIQDYQAFWKNLRQQYEQDPTNTKLNDVASLREMIKQHIPLHLQETDVWYDTGNLEGYEYAKSHIS